MIVTEFGTKKCWTGIGNADDSLYETEKPKVRKHLSKKMSQ